jgi:hypothetical protein
MLIHHLMMSTRTFSYITSLEPVEDRCRHVGMCLISQLQELDSQLTLARIGQTRALIPVACSFLKTWLSLVVWESLGITAEGLTPLFFG